MIESRSQPFDVLGLGYASDDYLAITPAITPFDHDPGTLSDFTRDGGGPVFFPEGCGWGPFIVFLCSDLFEAGDLLPYLSEFFL